MESQDGSRLIEIRWHARAGQGAVTAAKMLAECAISEGRYAQAMPEYGPERSGAPMKAYNRISSQPIRIHAQVRRPQYLIFLDFQLTSDRSYFKDLDPDCLILLNTPLAEPEARARLDGVPHALRLVDGDGISLKTTGKRFPNLPMLAAFAAASRLIRLETLKTQMMKYLDEKIGKDKAAHYAACLEEGYAAAQAGVPEAIHG